VTTVSILKQKKQIFFFFFRSQNLENLRGFSDPHQIFQENQGFNAFLCGNIFAIFAISVISSSHFLSDIVIVALTWLKKGPKKESQAKIGSDSRTMYPILQA
jgi:hypothetical protein